MDKTNNIFCPSLKDTPCKDGLKGHSDATELTLTIQLKSYPTEKLIRHLVISCDGVGFYLLPSLYALEEPSILSQDALVDRTCYLVDSCPGMICLRHYFYD